MEEDEQVQSRRSRRTMESTGVDTIYKALRLLPEFDGNPNVLTRFIQLCDQLVSVYMKPGPENELANLCLLNGILNKITGAAARTINSNGIPSSWIGIKSALINNFADQRDETALYNDMSLLSQGQGTPQDLYERCQSLFSTIMTYVTLHESVATTIEAKRELYKKLALQSFIRGLKEPLGSRIRCMRPETIEKALEYVQEEVNVMYLQNRNESLSDRKHPHYQPIIKMSPIHSVPSVPPMPMAQPHKFANPLPNWQQRPGTVPLWKPNNNYSHPQFSAPQRMVNMPTRTQQMFRAPPPNYNPHSNVFRMQPRNPNNFGANHSAAPKPMSGVVPYVPKPLPPSGHDWTRHGNPPPNNYFKSRETNFNDCYGYDDYEYGPTYDVDYFPEQNSEYYEYNPYLSCEPESSYSYQSIPEVNSNTDDISPQPSSSIPEDFPKASKSDRLK